MLSSSRERAAALPAVILGGHHGVFATQGSPDPLAGAARAGASAPPTGSFAGLDDIAMVDSSYIIIPPDVGGGVGPTAVMCTFNNNYRIQSKANGATILTLGPATFWNPVITNKALLGKLTDPRCTYDPFNNRWIVASQTTNNPGQILFGVSQNADPAG